MGDSILGIPVPGAPPGDPGTLRHGLPVWHALADEISGALSDFAGAFGALDWSSAGATAFQDGFAQAHHGSQQDVDTIRTFGDKLKETGDRIDQAQQVYNASLAAAVAAAGVGLGLTVFTLGISDGAAAAEVAADIGVIAAEETALDAFLGAVETAIEGVIQSFLRNFITQFIVNVVSQEATSVIAGKGLTMPNVENALVYSAAFSLVPGGGLGRVVLGSVGADALAQEITTGHVDMTQLALTAGTAGLFHLGGQALASWRSGDVVPAAGGEPDGQLALPGFTPGGGLEPPSEPPPPEQPPVAEGQMQLFTDRLGTGEIATGTSASPEGAFTSQYDVLDPARFTRNSDYALGGGQASDKTVLQDGATGQDYLFKNPEGGLKVQWAYDQGIDNASQARRAAAAGIVGDKLGIDTPGVSLVQHEGVNGSMQPLLDNTENIANYKLLHPDQWNAYQQSPQFAHARSDVAVLDRVIGSLDRKDDNFLIRVGPNGEPLGLVPIDHDFSFPADPNPQVFPGRDGSLPGQYTRSMYDRLTALAADPAALQADLGRTLSPVEIQAVRQRIDSVLADIHAKLAAGGPGATFFPGT